MRAPAAGQSLASDGTALDALRLSARQDPKGAIRAAARQFEALFMQELMKSMRASTMSDGMLDNQASEMATGMLDQQYAQQLTGLPGGLADAIQRQLEGQLGGVVGAATGQTSGSAGALAPLRMARPSTGLPAAGGVSASALQAAYGGARDGSERRSVQAAAAPESAAGAPDGRPLGRAEQFLRSHQASAEAVAAESGIPATFMLAQAAHETGWGRRQILQSDGNPSNNLFGIKAGPGWTGPVAVATTTEVIDGVAHKVQARFRAYSSPEESFRDYARLIGTSPRYAGVVAAGQDAGAFARGLQRAGYATDPDYASKLGRVISTTERLRRQLDV